MKNLSSLHNSLSILNYQLPIIKVIGKIDVRGWEEKDKGEQPKAKAGVKRQSEATKSEG